MPLVWDDVGSHADPALDTLSFIPDLFHAKYADVHTLGLPRYILLFRPLASWLVILTVFYLICYCRVLTTPVVEDPQGAKR